MELVDIATIVVPDNRQRREFDEDRLDDLVQSICSKGLMHPVVIANDGKTLVAGERRLRAIQKIFFEWNSIGFSCNGKEVPLGFVPCTRLADLDELSLREAELEENTIRVDLSMPERVQAIAELHSLRKEQNPKQTFKDTATEIEGHVAAGSQIAKVSDAIIISQHLANPKVAAAKTEKEAIKIIRQEMAELIRGTLAEMPDTKSSPHVLIQGDARVLLAELPESSVDVILTDPPYGIDAQAFGTQSFLSHSYDDSFATWSELIADLAHYSYVAAKPQAHAYVFCDIRNFHNLASIFQSFKWKVWPVPLIWDKGNGILPVPDRGPRRCYEAILFANKGERPTTAVYSDVIRVSSVSDREHAAQKPVDLYVDLLKRSVLPGDTILDPFCGSGPIFPAADAMKCNAIGFELADDAYATAKIRIA